MANENVRTVAIALVRRGSRWLVARRHQKAHLGGLWEFPGGKCETGETPQVAATRELREECGVLAVAERTLTPIRFDYGDREVVITPVICAWTAGDARPLESQECRWVSLAELRELAMPAANEQVVRELEESIAERQG